MIRTLLAFVLAVLVALPIVGSDGGENGGGTGIWILPRATCLASGHGTTPVDQKSVPSLSADLVMQVSSECGACTATLVDDVTGLPVALPVVGSRIRVPASLLQALAAGSTKASIVVLDDAGMGYAMTLAVSPMAGAVVKVF